ncbi:MAG TPA: hypothetical protein VL329_08535, partial [Nitrospiraceae bacterium]|nr:hypothetical protein [Nitrospiraceae bacterium]
MRHALRKYMTVNALQFRRRNAVDQSRAKRRPCALVIGMLIILPAVINPPRISAQTLIWEPLAEGLSVTVWEPG